MNDRELWPPNAPTKSSDQYAILVGGPHDGRILSPRPGTSVIDAATQDADGEWYYAVYERVDAGTFKLDRNEKLIRSPYEPVR